MIGGYAKAAPAGWARAARFGSIVATALLILAAAWELELVTRAIRGGWHGPVGMDFHLYLDYAQSWLAGSGWYLPGQLAGPYVVEDLNANVYPPVLLYLMVPFALGLPAILWWLVPGGIIAASLWRARPAWWAWPVLAFVFVYPRTWSVIVLGNPSMWSIAFLVAGAVWAWPAAFAVVKLPFAPLALLGASRRSWWIAVGFGLALALPFGGLWIDYAHVLLDGHSPRGLGYIIGEWPIALALVAVAMSGYRNRPMNQAIRRETRRPN